MPVCEKSFSRSAIVPMDEDATALRLLDRREEDDRKAKEEIDREKLRQARSMSSAAASNNISFP